MTFPPRKGRIRDGLLRVCFFTGNTLVTYLTEFRASNATVCPQSKTDEWPATAERRTRLIGEKAYANSPTGDKCNRGVWW